jgi:hypothetical protein
LEPDFMSGNSVEEIFDGSAELLDVGGRLRDAIEAVAR